MTNDKYVTQESDRVEETIADTSSIAGKNIQTDL